MRDVAVAHQRLQYALKQIGNEQAHNEGKESELSFLKEQAKLLRQEYGKPVRSPSTTTLIRGLIRGHGLSRTKDQQKISRSKTLYSAMVDDPLNIIGLVDALLGELREQGQFDLSLKEMRSEMAANIAEVVSSSTSQKARPLMNGLTTARYVAALLHECEHILGHMYGKNPQLKKVAPIALLKHLLTLTGTLMKPDQTLTLVKLIGGDQLPHQLAFLNALRNLLLYRLPQTLWSSKKDFYSVKDNLLALSTELTNEEQKLAQEKLALCNL
ncbi:hypothetical protein ACFQDN_22615 [Pseudomonas asuensis]